MSKAKILAVFMGFALFCYLTHVSNGEEPNALLSSMPSIKGAVDIPSEEPKLNNVGGLPHRKLLEFCGCPDGNKLEENQDSLIENDLHKAFEVFDSNGDGLISSEELQNALSRLGLWDEHSSSPDCKSIITAYDTNSDGFLDFEEFKDMMLFAKS
ncbi:putative calcium-binding protein CML44 [Forsythia ovata]|uniref:Calcium-binding protein CML44 n=1 Tax=Forsythia ovata TaxID=205694 RepID=A0ABD1U4M9_9LAMI